MGAPLAVPPSQRPTLTLQHLHRRSTPQIRPGYAFPDILYMWTAHMQQISCYGKANNTSYVFYIYGSLVLILFIFHLYEVFQLFTD